MGLVNFLTTATEGTEEVIEETVENADTLADKVVEAAENFIEFTNKPVVKVVAWTVIAVGVGVLIWKLGLKPWLKNRKKRFK